MNSRPNESVEEPLGLLIGSEPEVPAEQADLDPEQERLNRAVQ